MDKVGARNLARDYDNIQLKIIPDAGHQLNFENPEYVVNEICSGFQD
jgi:pimeloyl-ACP methyl ester carboxylesterase